MTLINKGIKTLLFNLLVIHNGTKLYQDPSIGRQIYYLSAKYYQINATVTQMGLEHVFSEPQALYTFQIWSVLMKMTT